MKKNSIIIKNGTIVSPDKSYLADLIIVGEKIKTISEVGALDLQKWSNEECEVIDAKDHLILPGGVDVHTHMELKVSDTISCDSFETGTKASLYGGTTTIIDFAGQKKGQSLSEALTLRQAHAYNNCFCDYSFHISITDVNENSLAEIEKMVFKNGISSFKTFLAYDALRLNYTEMEKVLKSVAPMQALVTTHAEDGILVNEKIDELARAKKLGPEFHPLSRPEEAEVRAISKLIKLALKHDCLLYIVHLTSSRALDILQTERENGARIFAETCPQYLLLDDSEYSKESFIDAAKFILSPPLRSKNNLRKLWQGIAEGKIQVVATDHCPFTTEQKMSGMGDFRKIPNGVGGVENRIELMYSEGVAKNRISINKLVEVCSSNPAKIFGLWPTKGEILEGSDADLIIFDPSSQHEIKASDTKMNSDYNIYEGMALKGLSKTVIHRGRIAKKDSKILTEKGRGKFLKRGLPHLVVGHATLGVLGGLFVFFFLNRICSHVIFLSIFISGQGKNILFL